MLQKLEEPELVKQLLEDLKTDSLRQRSKPDAASKKRRRGGKKSKTNNVRAHVLSR